MGWVLFELEAGSRPRCSFPPLPPAKAQSKLRAISGIRCQVHRLDGHQTFLVGDRHNEKILHRHEEILDRRQPCGGPIQTLKPWLHPYLQYLPRELCRRTNSLPVLCSPMKIWVGKLPHAPSPQSERPSFRLPAAERTGTATSTFAIEPLAQSLLSQSAGVIPCLITPQRLDSLLRNW